jgi:hypothetical protein
MESKMESAVELYVALKFNALLMLLLLMLSCIYVLGRTQNRENGSQMN